MMMSFRYCRISLSRIRCLISIVAIWIIMLLRCLLDPIFRPIYLLLFLPINIFVETKPSYRRFIRERFMILKSMLIFIKSISSWYKICLVRKGLMKTSTKSELISLKSVHTSISNSTWNSHKSSSTGTTTSQQNKNIS